MGETEEDRNSLLQATASLSPESTPLNFYHPNPALPIKTRNIELDEALAIITKAKNLLGDDKLLMVAGGRELLFTNQEDSMFKAGANAIVIGDYLTTNGITPSKDLNMLKKLGYKIATKCHISEV
jgi:biotin synthase